MHLSKTALYVGIIAYSLAILVFNDWGSMAAATGTVSTAFLAKMLLDVGLVLMAGIRLAGPTLFADEDADDEVAIHEEDLHFSDTALFGVFLLNLLGNFGWHAYQTVMTTGAVSFYYSIWTMVEFFAMALTWILFSHARKAQAKLARASKRKAQGSGQVAL